MVGGEARVQFHERVCSQLEAQVKSLRSTHSVYDKACRDLRGTLKEAYVSFLLDHYKAAQVQFPDSGSKIGWLGDTWCLFCSFAVGQAVALLSDAGVVIIVVVVGRHAMTACCLVIT